MQKQVLSENMVLYTFPEQPMHISILALFHEGNAFIVDTGYMEQAEAVKEDLATEGVKVQFVFNTHYNIDHICGNSAFPSAQFLGSEHYSFHLNRLGQFKPDITPVAPTVVFKGGERMTFGAFDLQFIHLPGHTDCSMALRINSHTLHVGDNIVRLLDGTDMVPYHMHPDSKMAEFICSLEQIRRLSPSRLVLSHAGVIEGQAEVKKAVGDRVKYMCCLQQLGSKATFKECASGSFPPNELNKQWHENNKRVLFDQ